MQSVKSTQVQKPVLQTATEPATVVAASAAVAQAQPQMAMPLTLPPKDPAAAAAASSGAKPPPSYEFSLQQQVMLSNGKCRIFLWTPCASSSIFTAAQPSVYKSTF